MTRIEGRSGAHRRTARGEIEAAARALLAEFGEVGELPRCEWTEAEEGRRFHVESAAGAGPGADAAALALAIAWGLSADGSLASADCAWSGLAEGPARAWESAMRCRLAHAGRRAASLAELGEWLRAPAREPLTVVEFAPGSRIRRDTPVRSALPLARPVPPATWVVFADGHGLGIPTDQLLASADAGVGARAEFGGMRFDGLEDGWLLFRRESEIWEDARLAPERGRTLKVRPEDVVRVAVRGRAVWP